MVNKIRDEELIEGLFSLNLPLMKNLLWFNLRKPTKIKYL